MEKIKVLIVEPNKEPYEKEIKNTLKKMQSVVGGLIEFVTLEENVDLVCNEEGKICNLKMNRIIPNDIICGTFFVVGQKRGDTISLTKEQVKKYKKYFALKEHKALIKLVERQYSSSDLLYGNLSYIEKLLEIRRSE